MKRICSWMMKKSLSSMKKLALHQFKLDRNFRAGLSVSIPSFEFRLSLQVHHKGVAYANV